MPKWTKEQEEAIYLKGQNIIVSAGAGSGKTAVLSERVLKHIESGIDIESLLVLTFTKAAAAEMKERIRQKLLANPKLQSQADKVDIASITTFDAYALSLVKKYHYLLNVSLDIKIIDEGILKIKKNEILNKIFEEYYRIEEPRFLKLINDFCLKDDLEIVTAILKINDKLDNLYDKQKYLNDYFTTFYNDDWFNSVKGEYLELIKSKINNIQAKIDYLSSYVDYSYIEKLNKSLEFLFDANTYEEIKNNCLISIPRMPNNSSEEAKIIKKEITKLLDNIKELVCYQNEDEIIKSLLKTKDYVSIIVEITLKLDDEINLFKQKNNAYEFVDIFSLAIKVVQENDFVLKEVKEKYAEILIDEYQDTNDLQDIFISLIQNNNVYMVGDIKQSIYRFRNANPLLFKEKYDNYSKLNGGLKIDLNKNFRSRKEVTNNINLLFNLIMDDKLGGADYIVSHQMDFGNTAYENVNNENYQMEILNYEIPKEFNFNKEEMEIFTIARDIQNKISNGFKIMDKETLQERNVCYDDFVILMDRSTAFEKYKQIFEYLNIPLTIYREQVISDSVDILLIKNILNLIIKIKDKIIDNSFKYSYVSICRSYLYSINDDEIFNDLLNNTFFKSDLYKKCLEISNNFDELSTEDLLNKIIEVFDFYDKLVLVGDVENHVITISSILKLAANLTDFGYDPRLFLDYLNEISTTDFDIKLSANKGNSNSVKIMTIHASKGLEYPICYFSGISKKFNISDLKDKFYYSNVYGILTPYIEDGLKNTILKPLLQRKYTMDEISEKIRLFYVALTRAREKIIIVSNLSENVLSFKNGSVINDETRENYKSVNDILCSVFNVLKPYITDIDLSSLNLTKNYNLVKNIPFKETLIGGNEIQVSEYEPPLEEVITSSKFSKDIHILYDKKSKDNIEFGIRMHKLFEITNFDNPNYDDLNSFEKNKIEKFINSGILNNYIKLYKEFEFIDEENQGIIDLLIEYETEYKIIDYKLMDVTDEAYKKQLMGYKKYIEKITNKEVKTYLYSIMDERIIEV